MAAGKDVDDAVFLKYACERGCVRSTAIIYHRYRHYLAGFIRRRIHGIVDEEDLVQVVFEQILEGKCRYAGRTPVRAYLTGVTKHVIHDHVKKQKGAARVLHPADGQVSHGGGVPRYVYLDPSEEVQRKEACQRVRTALSRLAPKCRQAVRMVYFDGLQPYDAANQLGCSLETFRKRLHRALQTLRTHLASP